MISKALEDLINEQLKSEMYSSNLYLSMSAYCSSRNLDGFAAFFRRQSEEEMTHVMKLYDFLLDRNAHVEIQAIDKPPTDFSSLVEVCQVFYDHEKEVTGMINNLYHLAQEENDYPTQVLLHWFIDEQVEEEKTALKVLEQVKMAGDNPAAILILDKHMGEEMEEEEEAGE